MTVELPQIPVGLANAALARPGSVSQTQEVGVLATPSGILYSPHATCSPGTSSMCSPGSLSDMQNLALFPKIY